MMNKSGIELRRGTGGLGMNEHECNATPPNIVVAYSAGAWDVYDQLDVYYANLTDIYYCPYCGEKLEV